MNGKIVRDKWYKASDYPKPQYKGSIYFVTKNGKKHIGTFNGYSQFINLDEEIFHESEVDKWIIRDWKREKDEPLKERFEYQGFNIFVRVRGDLGHHWKASVENSSPELYVNEESKKEAIRAIKYEIDQKFSKSL